MQNLNTVVIDQPLEVQHALASIGLTKEIVIGIAKSAAYARAEYLPSVDPVNFPGTRAYQEGTRQLRLQTKPDGWVTKKFNNIELIHSSDAGLMLGFQNVDHACSSKDPQAISRRGEGTKQLVSMPYQTNLFGGGNSVAYSSAPSGVFPVVWFVCVAAHADRIQVEVSRPKPFEGDQFNGFFERIFVADESLESDEPTPARLDDDIEDDHDFTITKKQNGNS
ncbi:MAG TPA: hypothetical protein VF682_19235 [Pseudomonas sp.]|jgi:hypothetical protein